MRLADLCPHGDWLARPAIRVIREIRVLLKMKNNVTEVITPLESLTFLKSILNTLPGGVPEQLNKHGVGALLQSAFTWIHQPGVRQGARPGYWAVTPSASLKAQNSKWVNRRSCKQLLYHYHNLRPFCSALRRFYCKYRSLQNAGSYVVSKR